MYTIKTQTQQHTKTGGINRHSLCVLLNITDYLCFNTTYCL